MESNGKSDALAERSRHFLWCSLACCLTYYLAQPPIALPILAWVACGIFSYIVAQYPTLTRRDHWIAWGAASLMWLLLLQGIRLAFWPLTAGWIALSLYLAVYFPLSLSIARSLHHRYRFPLALACAIGWTSAELFRSYIITGFTPCALAHSQTPWPFVLQIASHLGTYGVGFMMMLSMGWLVDVFLEARRGKSPPVFWVLANAHALIRIAIFAWFLLGYGAWTARERHIRQMEPIKPLGRIVLIQDHMPTMFDATAESIDEGWLSYEITTQRAIEAIRQDGAKGANPDASKIDLLVWPESIYSGLAPTMFWDRGQSVPATLGMDRQQLEIAFGNLERANAMKLRRLRLAVGGPLPNLLVGTDVIDIRNGAMDRYNSAVWIGNSGQPIDYYAKSHLVMFGEYIPVLSWFPSVMQSIGLATLSAGKEPKAWELASGRRVMANVCFEDTVPHLMRSQVQRLTARGKAPDVMINISNDGWFRGSSILDHHLNSAILTAVENRIPVLVAANTGITAWIDGDGRVIKRLPKMDAGWLVAEPIPDGRSGWWSTWGDWPAKFVSLIGLFPSILWIARRWSAKKTT